MEPTKEELEAEQAAAQAPKEDEIRGKIIKEFGFDEAADSEKIDRLVQLEVEHSKKLSQAIGQKINWRTRAQEAAKNPPAPKEEHGESLSPKDYLALQEAKVTSEDFDEVLRVSKILGKPISDSLKDDTLKLILSTRAEQRATAAATQVKSARGSTQASGESLLIEAEKGNIPESDSDIEKLVAARLEAKTRK